MNTREGKPPGEPILDRRKGRLINREEYVEGGTRYFLCDCDCGNKSVRVKARRFNDNAVTACQECRERGLAPNLFEHHPPRVKVSLDYDSLALLGYEAAEVGGSELRTLLREFAICVRSKASSLPFSTTEWIALRNATRRTRGALQSDLTPRAKLIRIGEACDVLLRMKLPVLDESQALATLAALRWAVTHPEDDTFHNPNARASE